MARIKQISIPTKILAESITATASSFKLNNIEGWDGDDLTSSDFGDRSYATFRSVDGSLVEFMRIDPTTIASTSITIVKRGLGYTADSSDTETTAHKLAWNANETLVELGSNPPQHLYQFPAKGNEETIEAVWTFDSDNRPKVDTDQDTTSDEEFVTKGELTRTALGTLTNNRIIVEGNAGATVAAGDLVYLDTADTEWKLCDADTAGSVENVMLGIAQGAGTDGASISGGVLLKGVDTHQTGLTVNSVYYASNTAGDISATPGTAEVTVGTSLSTTELYFNPRFNQQLTEDQQDALAGTSGTPSASNKYVTADDVAEAKTASKIARRDANSDILVATTPTSGDAAASKTYVDSYSPGKKIGQTTRISGAGTGTQDIAHGLGKTPTLVVIKAFQKDGGVQKMCFGHATSTSDEECQAQAWQLTTTTANLEQVSGAIIAMEDESSNDDGRATLSALDSTNITLNWTTAVSTTTYIQWEAFV